LALVNRRDGFDRRSRIGLQILALISLCSLSLSPSASAQIGPSTRPAVADVSPELIGRTVEEVRIVGNSQVSSQVILNLVRTHEGDKFDPATVEEDYQRIYGLKRFSNVQARVEPTRYGVAVVFQVNEQKLIHSIRFIGNAATSSADLEKAVDLKVGEAIEAFRISLAKRAILSTYRDKNYPFTTVDVAMDSLTNSGDAVFKIVEGPEVTIRKIEFVGHLTYTKSKLNDQIKTTRWYWIFNAGTFDPEVVEDDVAALRRFYQEKGFFDVKVGRKLVFSPDQTELQIDFLIDEGPRYKVDHVSFTGNVNLSEAQLKQNLNLTEGRYFDLDLMERDKKQIVKAYSPLGYIYDAQSTNPDYLRIGDPRYSFPAKLIYHKEPGTVELVYEISEGKPFHIGNIIVKGNEKTQEKVVRRELHVASNQLYNSGELSDAMDRLRGTAYFDNATITPIGDDPQSRDLLVEVKEKRTANVAVGAGVNSNGGVQGNFSFQQDNFDLTNIPENWRDIASDRAFTGAGQTFRVQFEPGTQITNASVLFSDPYVFDQPYSITSEAYFRSYIREAWDEQHEGGRITVGKRLDNVWSTGVTFRGEDVKVGSIQDFFPLEDRVDIIDHLTGEPRINPTNGGVATEPRSVRAPDILAVAGHSTLTSVGLQFRRDDTNRGPLLYKGTSTVLDYQAYGGLGGAYYFHKFTIGFDAYQSVFEDLLDRRTVLDFHFDTGYITRNAPFFERFYGGGLGSVRGFAYRGISPREGRETDPVGGNFSLQGTIQLNYPIYGENLRGVVFTDFGTVEEDIRVHTIRSSIGAGVRLVLPIFGSAQLALDFAIPMSKAQEDTTQFFSFSFAPKF
jgi:outer membrane protein insertion porin family